MCILPVIVAKREQRWARHTCRWGSDRWLEAEAALVLFMEADLYEDMMRRQGLAGL